MVTPAFGFINTFDISHIPTNGNYGPPSLFLPSGETGKHLTTVTGKLAETQVNEGLREG